jgi:hypothetical protein
MKTFILLVTSSLLFAASLNAQTEKELQAEIATLQAQVKALQGNSVQALVPFVSVDPNPELGVAGPNIVITGANVHIVNGMGPTPVSATPIINGLGNLVVGYNEWEAGAVPSPSRGGSHNVVIGRCHQFPATGFGNLICGENNTAKGEEGFVAGYFNTTTALYTSILGGRNNQTTASYSSVVSGASNQANSDGAVVLGGCYNQENAAYSITLGGYNNQDAASIGEFIVNLY